MLKPRTITKQDAHDILAEIPPDFTTSEWAEIRNEALRMGYFTLAGQKYIIEEKKVCDCPHEVTKVRCLFDLPEENEIICNAMCGRFIAEQRRYCETIKRLGSMREAPSVALPQGKGQ